MATVDFSNLSQKYAIGSDNLAFDTFSAVGATFYEYTTTAGHQIVINGTDFIVDGSNNLTGGTITSISIDLGADDPTGYDILITDLNISVEDFNDGEPGQTDTERFWSKVLAGQTTIHQIGSFETDFAGDFAHITAAGLFFGGNDTFSLADITFNDAYGDAIDVTDAILYGGNDTFTGVTKSIHGDARNLFGNAIVVGGNDDIEITGDGTNTQVITLVGDVLDQSNNSSMFGGDDRIDASAVTGNGIINDMRLYGDTGITRSTSFTEGGDDTLIAGDVNTLVFGDAASVLDSSIVFAGDDTIKGGKANDTLYGDVGGIVNGTVLGGNDTIDGGNGNDLIYGDFASNSGGDVSAGRDVLRGQNGNDTIYGGTGKDQLFGGKGSDILFAGEGKDTLEGGRGDDTLYGDAGTNTLISDEGTNTFVLTDGENTVIFDDRFSGGALVGGHVDDVIDFSGVSEGFSIDFATLNITFESGKIVTDDLAGRNYIGTNFDDTFTLRYVNDKFDAGGGTDTLSLELLINFSSFIDMQTGELIGFKDVSLINFEDFIGGNGADSVSGTSGSNHMSGRENNDILSGRGGKDTILGEEGFDSLYGGSGNDRLEGGDDNDLLEGGGANDALFGGLGLDTLFGNDGKDELKGGGDVDILFGGKGKDELFGGGGQDTLIGNKGDDKYTGGGGADNFEFAKNHDKDTILDFSNNTDTIRLNDNLWSGTLSVSDVLNDFGSINDGKAVLNFGDGDVLRIEGVTNLNQLSNDIEIF